MPISDKIRLAAAAFIGDRYLLSAYVKGLIKDNHAAEDIIQETWLRLSDFIASGKTPENQSAWCRGTARNLILRHWRNLKHSKVRYDSPAMELLMDQVDQAFDEAGAKDRANDQLMALRDCVAKLPEKSRQLLAKRHVEDLPLTVIAGYAGMSEHAIIKTLYRLRRALFECVKLKTS